MVETATEIMFSYLVFIGFIIVFISLTGQNFFGSAFPTNPFSTVVFSPATCTPSSCASGDWACGATLLVCQSLIFVNTIIKILLIPFQIITYVWEIFIFFMVSPTLWWVGLVLFVPAGIILLFLILPIIIALIQAIATIIP
jgi:hypothetical protein